MTTPWLTFIGIGEDGREGLSPLAQRLIDQASFIMGGVRHLSLIGPVKGEAKSWPHPFEDGIKEIIARRGQETVVIASGDPFLYGVGATLSHHIEAEEMLVIPAPSAFSLMASRVGWALQECAQLTLHGRPLEKIIPHLQPHARLLALSWDGETPNKLAALLVERGMGESVLHIGEALGGPREKRHRLIAQDLHTTPKQFDPLNTIGLEIVAGRNARIIPLASGLDESWFEHDNQITKREIRAITLSSLQPHQGALLWDIGAGSGSVSIEWMLCHPANRAIAIEVRPDRAQRITRNALSFGLPELLVIEDEAPDALKDLPQPDAIFIGGGGTDPRVIDTALAALKTGGRLVVNAVTIETQADVMKRHVEQGGTLIKIDIARADPVGPFHGWRASMPVIQWTFVKDHVS
ncbi:MAG: precorrin-6y C5,15-methyltransferase (decarboxylating) subunit CbiE [Hyphomicrobiales bacterium]|nr:precorrin-6y C5,15-methyltransferase (decarboxylating) subunit CbiE [Hyphomicrobiales bacterium]